MKKIIPVLLLSALFSMQAFAQKPAEDKSKRPSPPAQATQKISSGATISISYSRISLKGREIGKTVEPMEGKVWRTGANEATVFETDKDVTINGKPLPAGKYALFSIFNGNDVTLIFNKTWNQWGAFEYKEADDALRVQAKASDNSKSPSEKLTFHISSSGEVKMMWGPKEVTFNVK